MRKVLIGLVLGVLIMLPIGQARNHEYADLPIRYAMTGWVEEAESRTWSYVSADAPSYVLSVDEDITDIISAGMKIRCKQDAGTYLYGFITKVELSGANTLVTVYGGTDYTFANQAITDVAISNVKAPHGFPMSPDKWSVSVSDSTDRSTTTFSSVVQLDSSHQINIPIGVWYVSYQAYIGWTGVTTNMNVNLALSTTNNSFSTSEYVRGIQTIATSSPTPLALSIEMNPKPLVLTSKTTYYLVGSFISTTGTNWGFTPSGGYAPTEIRAVIAYL